MSSPLDTIAMFLILRENNFTLAITREPIFEVVGFCFGH